ncbi:MAG TPA: tetratricopeptide repeat protein, partial [Candidatus Elarobacter sp.]|nr:tetratricopeptide repeat protein [Candidatus Elarobacter sp.]
TFSAASVAAVCAGHPPAHAIGEILAGLVRKSLLVVDASGPATRFRMLETIRQYAAAKLAQSGDAASVKQRHALHYYEIAAAAAHAAGPSNQEFARRDLELEIPNLRESLEWSTSASRNVYLGAAIAAQLVEFWAARGDFVEAEHWLRRTVESESELLANGVRAKLHEGLALVAYRRGRLAEAIEDASKALIVYASIADTSGTLRARDLLGLAALDGGELEVARDRFESTLADARAMNDPRAISTSLNNLGRLTCDEGRFEAAMPLFAESLATARTNGLVSQAISALTNLSECALALGHYSAGLTYARLGIADAEKLGNREATADLALQAVAHLLRSDGLAAARAEASFAWEAIIDVPYRPPIAARLDDVALALHAVGEPRRAATLLGASDAFRRRGELLGSVRAGERRRIARAEIGEMLSPGEAEALTTRGASLLLRDAFREALLDD